MFYCYRFHAVKIQNALDLKKARNGKSVKSGKFEQRLKNPTPLLNYHN